MLSATIESVTFSWVYIAAPSREKKTATASVACSLSGIRSIVTGRFWPDLRIRGGWEVRVPSMRNHLDNRAMASAWTEQPSDGETAHPHTGKTRCRARLVQGASELPSRKGHAYCPGTHAFAHFRFVRAERRGMCWPARTFRRG